jgi:hypothetical protein
MEKSQQRVIVYSFSLKGWPRKIQKELTNALGSDGYSQVQISRWLARFSSGAFPVSMKLDPEDRSQSWDHHWNIS